MHQSSSYEKLSALEKLFSRKPETSIPEFVNLRATRVKKKSINCDLSGHDNNDLTDKTVLQHQSEKGLSGGSITDDNLLLQNDNTDSQCSAMIPKSFNKEFVKVHEVYKDKQVESLKHKVYQMLMDIAEDNKVSAKVIETERTLDDEFKLFIDINTINEQSLQCDKCNFMLGSDDIIKMIFDRQTWLKDFLYNFPLIFMTGFYTKEQVQQFFNGLKIVFETCEANIEVKNKFNDAIQGISVSTKHFFGITLDL